MLARKLNDVVLVLEMSALQQILWQKIYYINTYISLLGQSDNIQNVSYAPTFMIGQKNIPHQASLIRTHISKALNLSHHSFIEANVTSTMLIW